MPAEECPTLRTWPTVEQTRPWKKTIASTSGTGECRASLFLCPQSCNVRCKPSADRTQECLPLRTGLSLRASGGAWQQPLLPLIVMRACSCGIMETVVANEIYCLASDTRRLFEGSPCAGDHNNWVQQWHRLSLVWPALGSGTERSA